MSRSNSMIHHRFSFMTAGVEDGRKSSQIPVWTYGPFQTRGSLAPSTRPNPSQPNNTEDLVNPVHITRTTGIHRISVSWNTRQHPGDRGEDKEDKVPTPYSPSAFYFLLPAAKPHLRSCLASTRGGRIFPPRRRLRTRAPSWT